MATIRERSGKLIADFRYMGIRCRETTNLEDNVYNRRLLTKRLEQLEAEITLGTFEYGKYFPKSKRIEDFKEKEANKLQFKPMCHYSKILRIFGSNKNKSNGEALIRKKFKL